MWVEIDSFDPRALALIRRSIGTPSRAAKAFSAVASSKISSGIMLWTSALSTCPGTASSSR